MRAVLTSVGTIGDVQPIFALAVALATAGHHPVVALSPNYRARAQQLGLPFKAIGPPMDEGVVRAGNIRFGSLATVAEQTHFFLETVAQCAQAMYHDLTACCQGADVLISVPHQFVGRMVYDALGIPFVTVSLSYFGELGAADLMAASAPVINGCRERAGLTALPDPLSRDGVSSQLALYAVSKRILKASASWPKHRHVCGFFFLDEDWTPDPSLARFIESGDPPIVVSFSSMMHVDPASIGAALVAAGKQVGRRMVIVGGWSGLDSQDMATVNTFHLKGFVPHHWLFSRACCIVHHGGAGTTAAALRAGAPSVVVPHFLDQPIWAELARGLGCAGAIIPFAQLTSDNLATGIDTTLSSIRINATAKSVANYIEQENGASVACAPIEEFASS